jgi:hypothetical protein
VNLQTNFKRQGTEWPELDDIKRQLQDAEIEFDKKKKSNHHDKSIWTTD